MVRSLTMLVYRWRIVLHDILVIPAAWLVAYWLRYNLGAIPEEFLRSAVFTLPVVVAVQSVTNVFVGVHRGDPSPRTLRESCPAQGDPQVCLRGTSSRKRTGGSTALSSTSPGASSRSWQ